MSVLRQVVAHPANAAHPWKAAARWAIHNVRRRLMPNRVVTTPVGRRFLSGPASHPVMCLAIYIPAGQYDADAFWALNQLLDAGDTFVDVGANIGMFSVQVDPAVGSSGRILAIEPAPDQAVFLQANLDRLEATTTIVEAAVADTERRLDLCSPGPSTGFLVHTDGGGGAVETVTLDAVVGHLDATFQFERCVVKIDIEGWEPAALMGGSRLVAGGVRAFLIEALGHQHRCEIRWDDAVDLLHRNGYRFVWPEVQRGILHEFEAPGQRSPFGDYLAVQSDGYDRLRRALDGRISR